MNEIILPDGTPVEWCRSQHRPGSTFGYQQNGPAPIWVRVGEGPWTVVSYMSMLRLLRDLEACDTEDEVLELVVRQ